MTVDAMPAAALLEKKAETANDKKKSKKDLTKTRLCTYYTQRGLATHRRVRGSIVSCEEHGISNSGMDMCREQGWITTNMLPTKIKPDHYAMGRTG